MAVSTNLLPGGRPVRALEGTFTQPQMFALSGKFNPKTEGIITVKDADTALQAHLCLTEGCVGRVRAAEYAVYSSHRDAPLGKEIVWMENGVFYRHSIPDVPVTQDDSQISLRKATGMAVYESIGLLKIDQECSNAFTVSVVDEAALAGKVRVVDFIRNGWAYLDSHGFPLQRLRTLSTIEAARYGITIARFNEDSTGWHGSISRHVLYDSADGRRFIYASDYWSQAWGVAIAGSPPTRP